MVFNTADQQKVSNEELMLTLQMSECIFTTKEVNAAYDKLANALNVRYVGLNPIVMVVMRGGLITAGQIMPRISFLHRMDYVHATRYKNNKPTDELSWIVKPHIDIKNEHVLLIDDIFDQGITLKTIVEELKQQQPKSIKTCVLLNKEHDRKVANFEPDFVGLTVEDLFVYGCGMDYHGYLRHLSGIFAAKIPD